MKSALVVVALSLVVSIIGYLVGVARFYSLCLNVSRNYGYAFLLLPLVTVCTIAMLTNKQQYSDKIMTLSMLILQLPLMYAIFRLMRGRCMMCA